MFVFRDNEKWVSGEIIPHRAVTLPVGGQSNERSFLQERTDYVGESIWNYKETLGAKAKTLWNVSRCLTSLISKSVIWVTPGDNVVLCERVSAEKRVTWFSGSEAMGSQWHCVSELPPGAQGLQLWLSQPPNALGRLGRDAGRRHPAQRACLKNHQPKPWARSGELSDWHFHYSPAHCGAAPPTSQTALSRPAAPHFPARSENSGSANRRGRRGARGAHCACARQLPAPGPLPLRPTWYGRAVGVLRGSSLRRAFQIIPLEEWRRPGCGAGDGGADPEGSRARPCGASRPAGEWEGPSFQSSRRCLVLSGKPSLRVSSSAAARNKGKE